MKRQRGSAMVLVLVMTVAITSIIVASGGLTENAINIVSLKQAEKQARYSIDGKNLQNLSGVKVGTVSVSPAFMAVDTSPVADETVNAAVIDNAATLAGSVKLTASYRVRERTYNYTDVMGKRKTPKPNYYSLFVNSAMSLTKNLTTGTAGANGDVWINGNVTLGGATNTVNGDIEAAGTVGGTVTVTETNWPSAPVLSMPNPVRANYSSGAAQSFASSQTFNNYTFSSAYRLIYISGDLHLTGTITGTGTFYITGRAYIDGVTSYANAGSRMAIIAENGVEVVDAATTYVGYYYTTTNYRVRGTTTTHTLTSGGVAAGSVTFDSPVAITHDPTVWTDDTEGTKLKLPGYWP